MVSSREYLRNAVGARSGVSWRSIARELGIKPAHLSMIMTGKRRLQPELAIRIANVLGWDELRMEGFIELVYRDLADHPKLREIHSVRANKILEVLGPA